MTSRGERATENGTAVVPVFPWELAIGAFAGASVLLAIVLERAGSTVPALIFGLLGAVITGVAAITGWRRVKANPRRGGRGRSVQIAGRGSISSIDRPDFGGASPGDTVRSPMATRTGEDGADIDLGKIPDFRARRDQVAVVPRDAPVGGQAGVRGDAVPVSGDDAGWDAGGGRVVAPQLEGLARDFQTVAGAMAAAVLVRRGRLLVPLVASGDWSAAREVRAGSAPGTFEARSALSDAAPPEFPVDDQLADLLAAVSKALPLERWQEIEDVPPGFLPLVGLLDHGASLAVASAYRREFLALWVASGRDGSRRYSDRDLGALEAFVRERVSVVGADLAAATLPTGRA